MWFGLLGPLLVRIGGRDRQVPAAKQRVLLAALLLSPRRAVSPGRLCEVLWDDAPPPGAVVTLRSYVKRLRQVLGPEGGSRIVSAPGGYLIEAAEGELDVAQFEALCGAGESAMRAQEWQRAVELLGEAERLRRDVPLADIPSRVL